jgi:succinoglycan biosynthesis protein ExoW
MPTIAVVIPFYQRTQGILARSLASVFAQHLPADTHVMIVIVDDQSPIALEAELATIAVPEPYSIVALARPNGGPGAARNTALESLSADSIDFVAFLDSDDIWQPRHLAEGLAALGDSTDFYFCDHERWHNADSWFAESKAIPQWLAGADDMVSPVPAVPDLFEFRRGRALLAFLVDYMAQTSTVIYRFAPFARLRFDATLRHAGEDNMFWLDLAEGARAVRFSRHANVATGEGVNMYFSSLKSWDHPDAARRIGFNLLFLARATGRFGKVDRARALMRDRYWACQKEFAWVWVRHALMTRSIDLDPVRSVVKERRSLLATLPLAFLAAALRRPHGAA